MKNFVQRGGRITFAASQLLGPNSPILSGDPVQVGRLCGVAVANATPGAAGPFNDSNVVVEVEGVFTLAVKSNQHTGVTVGETIYQDQTTGVLSDTDTGVPFGIALDVVALGATTTIRVKLFGGTPGVTGFGS